MGERRITVGVDKNYLYSPYNPEHYFLQKMECFFKIVYFKV